MKKFYALTLLLSLISCGSKMSLVSNKPINNTFPEIGKITTAEIGITLVTKETGFIYKALQINEDRKVKPGNFVRELKKGELFLNKFETKKYYLYESANNNSFGIAVPKDGSQQMFYSIAGMSIRIVKLNSSINVSEISVPLKEKEYFKQEFIYNGKVGNGIKFIYREFINDYARPSYTQELQYDLSESRIIGFRGLRLEVVNANNTNIEYKLLNQFQN